MEGIEVAVVEMDAHRIARVRVSSGGTTAEAEEAGAASEADALVEEPSDVGDDTEHRETAAEDVEIVSDDAEREVGPDSSEPNEATGTGDVALVRRIPGG